MSAFKRKRFVAHGTWRLRSTGRVATTRHVVIGPEVDLVVFQFTDERGERNMPTRDFLSRFERVRTSQEQRFSDARARVAQGLHSWRDTPRR